MSLGKFLCVLAGLTFAIATSCAKGSSTIKDPACGQDAADACLTDNDRAWCTAIGGSWAQLYPNIPTSGHCAVSYLPPKPSGVVSPPAPQDAAIIALQDKLDFCKAIEIRAMGHCKKAIVIPDAADFQKFVDDASKQQDDNLLRILKMLQEGLPPTVKPTPASP